MYDPSELVISPSDPYTFTLTTTPTPSNATTPISLSMNCTLPPSYPRTGPSIYLLSKELSKPQLTLLTTKMSTELKEALEIETEFLILHIQNFLQTEIEDNFSSYPIAVIKGSGTGSGAKEEAQRMKEIEEKNRKGFMREWCSFVSLYKDSYISGPNRFEVLQSLAEGRGLNITGLAISGKPGGIVIEGGAGSVEAFMHLIRTEFFETLNPRGRKITTRLQEKWPEDWMEVRTPLGAKRRDGNTIFVVVIRLCL